jgi:hypothetical protein
MRRLLIGRHLSNVRGRKSSQDQDSQDSQDFQDQECCGLGEERNLWLCWKPYGS